jgi:hypothetical protein
MGEGVTDFSSSNAYLCIQKIMTQGDGPARKPGRGGQTSRPHRLFFWISFGLTIGLILACAPLYSRDGAPR